MFLVDFEAQEVGNIFFWWVLFECLTDKTPEFSIRKSPVGPKALMIMNCFEEWSYHGIHHLP